MREGWDVGVWFEGRDEVLWIGHFDVGRGVVGSLELTRVHHGVDGALWEDGQFSGCQYRLDDTGSILFDSECMGFTLNTVSRMTMQRHVYAGMYPYL